MRGLPAGRLHPRLRPATAPDTDAAQALPSAEGCPVEAISITPADSGEAVFPPAE